MTNTAADLFFYRPDVSGRFPRVVSGPRDLYGGGIRLRDVFTGLQIGPVAFQLESDYHGAIDFLHEIGLNLVVSERCMATLRTLRLGKIETFPVVLLDKVGNEVLPMKLVKVNEVFDVLDRAKSLATFSPRGVVRTIQQYRVAPERVPALDLFKCALTRGKLLSGEAVSEIRAAGLEGAEFVPIASLVWP